MSKGEKARGERTLPTITCDMLWLKGRSFGGTVDSGVKRAQHAMSGASVS